MGGGDAGDMVFAWVGGVIVLSVALPVLLAAWLLFTIAKLLWRLCRAAYELARGNAYRREMRRTIRARNQAIGDIVALHNHAIREMTASAGSTGHSDAEGGGNGRARAAIGRLPLEQSAG